MKHKISFNAIVLVTVMAAFGAFQCHVMAHKTVKNGFYPHSLADFSTTGRSFGAGVMPYYEDEKGEKYVLIGREVNSGRKREWAFFSGGSELNSSDKSRMEHPLDCAAREFYEEAALHATLGWDEATTKNYIAQHATEVIAQYSRDLRSRPAIIYMVKFEKDQIEKIVDRYKYIFTEHTVDDRFKEKDALAVVKYQDLIDAVKQNKQRVALDKNLPSWFNSDKEDTILMFYMPYYLLRARYAPDDIFRVSGRAYHYVQDACMCGQNHQFLAQEPVKKSFRSKL